ncbi:MFS transporter [Paenibacillus thiaminolyticus]|uniref:MFS transporter n=1 Tax=Paenibacillus thiaminolyticus TaxID=49283 RepID=A0ABT4FZ58_PANTH|nr:MFS transporter [Paenibacillus thiaminolyticus]MCY9534354.1 MFS transporter [Paenibacillus thiaminolyticus]MCY9602882.1 MFS transporter [Paenibacillus thiaminolyticus]MCY9608296.1 MFS transporter [Paenibacillus thiaminolyticus]MCY9614419.1 MFS transporter [Paenibacillus thiaminolyticus]MCY9618208.1 MFS transporter [Paenibacillus thiaminolyticus]
MKGLRGLGLGRDIALLAIILFFVEFVRGAALISFIPIYGKNTLHISLAIIGTAITAHYLTDTILKMGIGYLLDRFSPRLIINAGLLISFAGIGLFYYGSSDWLFIAAAALYGVGISPVWIVCLTKVKEENRAAQMGFLYMIWLVGMGAGPVVLNLIVDKHPQTAYLLLFALSGIAWVLSFFVGGGRQQLADAAPVPFRQQWDALLVKVKAMKPLLPGMILQTLGASMLVPILPTFAAEALSFSSQQYSVLLVLGGGFTVLGLVPMGKWSDRVGRKPFLIIGFGIFGLALASLSLYPSVIFAYGLAVLLGISYSAVLPAWNALLALYVPPGHKGLGWSLLSTVEGIGVLLGPVIGGVIANVSSAGTVIWISAGLFTAISIIYLLFPSRWFAER